MCIRDSLYIDFVGLLRKHLIKFFLNHYIKNKCFTFILGGQYVNQCRSSQLTTLPFYYKEKTRVFIFVLLNFLRISDCLGFLLIHTLFFVASPIILSYCSFSIGFENIAAHLAGLLV